VSHQVIVQLIGATTTETGLKVKRWQLSEVEVLFLQGLLRTGAAPQNYATARYREI